MRIRPEPALPAVEASFAKIFSTSYIKRFAVVGLRRRNIAVGLRVEGRALFHFVGSLIMKKLVGMGKRSLHMFVNIVVWIIRK